MKTQAPAYTFAKIKDLWLEVANCDFFHSHLGEDGSGYFFGRTKAKERLKMLLRHSTSRSGAYLVTGFRGMGKTSLVHEALKELKDESSQYSFEKISISLSQDDIRDMDVLRLIARQLAERWGEILERPLITHPLVQNWKLLSASLLGFATTLFLLIYWSPPYVKGLLWGLTTLSPWICFLVFTLCLLTGFFFFRTLFLSITGTYSLANAPGDIKKRLEWLIKRIDSAVTREHSASITPEMSVGVLGSFGMSRQRRESLAFQIASPKEIEKDLISILDDIDKYRTKLRGRIPKFVFILDELDKIEPDFLTVPALAGNNQQNTTTAPINQRRETIARLLSNLKSFLNEAKAKFIFVGGREMYDATLADIADRESFYSSIFHGVIYLNSFFKDKIQQRAGVTRITEAYLCHMLIPDWYLEKFIKNYPNKDKCKEIDEDEWYSLGTLYHYLVDCQQYKTGKKGQGCRYWEAVFEHPSGQMAPSTPDARAAVYKILYLLQNFTIYLTYRSSGTPKKLAGLLEQYIMPGMEDRTPGHGCVGSFICDLGFEGLNKPDADSKEKRLGNDIILFRLPEPGKKVPDKHDVTGKLFLKFNFNQQYEIGLTSNFYRPYVIIHSRYLKALGDKLLYSTSYIMDYILKFHPHGFSWRNLEMIPDVILTNKDPNLRMFMQELMQFLSRMHIRETINGMFQFRFYSKVVNEIRFLSKISEQGTAAFNFTLDESQQIKHYYRDKLNKLLRQHEDPVQFSHGQSMPFIHSIAFLQNMLGDLHYYDKEYDDAIIYYSEAAQPLRERVATGNLTNHQVVLLVRTQLKLGMALEKIRAFDPAYSIYRSLIMDMPKLLQLQIRDENPSDRETGRKSKEDRPLRRMQLLVRPYIAILDLVEKQRIDGVTFSNLRRNLEDLNILLDSPRLYPLLDPPSRLGPVAPTGEPHKDSTRLNTLYSDYFSNIGSILYFKNLNYPELYEAFKNGFEQEHWSVFKRENSGFKELKNSTLAEFINKHRGGDKNGNPIYYYNPSLSAYIYYRQAISDQFASFKKDLFSAFNAAGNKDQFSEGDSDLLNAALLLHPEAGYLTNNLQLYILGNLYSKLGDTVLGSAGGNVRPLDEAILNIYKYDDTGGDFKEHLLVCLNYLRPEPESEDDLFDNCLNVALVLYRIAGFFYLKANRSFTYAFQFKKFLFVVKDWLAFYGDNWLKCKDVPVEQREGEADRRKDLLTMLEKLLIDDHKGSPSIANRLFHNITWTSDGANRPQLLKYREILQVSRDQDTASIYNNISTSAETREVVLLIEEIRLKLARLGIVEKPLELKIITPYDTITSKYLRVFELKYKCEYNYARFVDLNAEAFCFFNYFKGEGEPDEFENRWNAIEPKHLVELQNYILDSIFCLYEIIRSLNIYGINYVTNHSFLANAHYKLANWCRAYENFKFGHLKNLKVRSPEYRVESQRYDDTLVKLLGTDALYTLEVNYHNEQAIEHYYAAIQTHKGGKSYRDNIINMSFLEDDLNDSLTHFSAATERFRVNTGTIRVKIEKLKKAIGESQLYDFESYAGIDPISS